MPISINCPDCDARLTLRAVPTAGARLKCPECSTLFAYKGSSDTEPPASKKPAAVAPPRRRPRQDEIEDSDLEDEDEERRPRRRKKARSGSNAGLIIGLSVGGGILVVGLVIALVVLVVGRKTDGGNQQAIVNPPPAAPLVNNPPQGNQPGNKAGENNLAGNNPGGNNPAGNKPADNKPIAPNPAPPPPPPVKLTPAELYGDQGGEPVAPANAGAPNTVMRARRDDTFIKLSNPREGQTIARGQKLNALLVDYAVVSRGKFDAATLVVHWEDGHRSEVALDSELRRDHGTITLVGATRAGNRMARSTKSTPTNVDFPENIEMYVTRSDAHYRPPPKFLVSNTVVMGQMKVTTRARDWTAEELDRYGKPPPNYVTPNVHPTVGEDVPPLAAGGSRFVEPDGRLLGLEYRLGEWNKEKCVGGLVPIFSADQPPSLPTRVMARPGYAVAGAEVHTGKLVYAIRLLFRRVKPDGSLDAADAYASEWIGVPPPGQAKTLANDGRRVLGIHLQQVAVVDRFALVVAK